jgi:hypothetical protein
LPLDAVMPIGDDRPVLCTDPHQRGLGVGQFEIKADRDDLRDAPAVIELEHRHCAFRVDRAEFGLELLAGAQIDLHSRHRDPFFRQEDADATRVWGKLIIVELHRTVLRQPWSGIEPSNNLVPPERPLSDQAVVMGSRVDRAVLPRPDPHDSPAIGRGGCG